MILETLHIACIEAQISWEAPQKNKEYFETQLEKLPAETNLVLLPEMFTTGFSMQPKIFAETPQGETLRWMQYCAKKFNILLGGSLIILEDNKYYNRFYLTEPSGTQHHYDKRHLFRMGNEDKHYTAGTKNCIVNYKGWRIMLQICYDLRFPVWTRNQNNYDLLLYVANFPANRRHVWNTLLTARAIENQCFVVGCNRIGTDYMGINYMGDSQIISPKGLILSSKETNNDTIVKGSISLSELKIFREQFPVFLDGDTFSVCD